MPSLEFVNLCELMLDNFDPTKDTQSIPTTLIRDDVAHRMAARLRLNPNIFGTIPGPSSPTVLTPNIPASTMNPIPPFPVHPFAGANGAVPAPNTAVINLTKQNIGNLIQHNRSSANPTILLNGNNQWNLQYGNHSNQTAYPFPTAIHHQNSNFGPVPVQSLNHGVSPRQNTNTTQRPPRPPAPYEFNGAAPLRFNSNVASSSPRYLPQHQRPPVPRSQPQQSSMFQGQYGRQPRSSPRVPSKHRKIPNPTSWNVGGM